MLDTNSSAESGSSAHSANLDLFNFPNATAFASTGDTGFLLPDAVSAFCTPATVHEAS